MAEVLIELPGGAGVIRSDDERFDYCLTSDVSSGNGQPFAYQDRYAPERIDLGDDRRLVGGLLPPGAVSAEAVDDRGTRVSATTAGEVYAVVLEASDWQIEPAVCFRDETQNLVRRPWAADYPSERVSDARDRCPACDALDWEEYTPFEQWRGGRGTPTGETIPNPVVACRACGHQEAEGSFMSMSSQDGDEEEDEQIRAERIARFRAQLRRREWLSAAPMLRDATFAMYAVQGWPAHLSGRGWDDNGLHDVTVGHYDRPEADPTAGAHPRITVSTSSRGYPPPLEQARSTLQHWIQTGPPSWPDLSRAALTLWLRARERKLRAAVLNATESSEQLSVDGTEIPVTVLQSGENRWVTAFQFAELTIVVAAHDLSADAIHLVRVKDPVRQLLGPEPPDVQ